MVHRNLRVGGLSNQNSSFSATKRVAVVGEDEVAYGLAKELTKAGLEVALIMKTSQIVPLDLTAEDALFQERLDRNRLVRVYPLSTVIDCSGFAGAFRLIITSRSQIEELEVGAIAVTTGYEYQLPLEFADWSSFGRVCSVRDSLRFLFDGDLESVVFVAPPFASAFEFRQILQAAQVALDKDISRVFILCNDVRVSDRGLETFYTSLRDRGVLFIKYGNAIPAVKENHTSRSITIQTDDISLGGIMKEKMIECDRVFVAERVVSDRAGEELALLLGINIDAQGFLQDDNVYHFPIQSNRRGIYVAGLAKGETGDIQLQQDVGAVTGEICDLIGNGRIVVNWVTSHVDSDKCALCLTCLRSCPACAIRVDYENRSAEVVDVACQGCGICSSVCPAMAIQLKGFPEAIEVAIT